MNTLRGAAAGGAQPAATRRVPLRARPWWPWAKRIGMTGFLALIAVLLVVQARVIAWDRVADAVRAYPARTLLLAAACAALGHFVYASFDLVGRRYTGHRLPVPAVMTVTFISYAFNLNMGTLVGAVGMRARLYARLGLAPGEITRIVGLSMLTNWLGYCALAGAVFMAWPMPLPDDWRLGSGALRVLGAALLCVALAYLLLCAFSRRRAWVLRGHTVELPGLRSACAQLGLSCVSWALMGLTVCVLLQEAVTYTAALAALLVGAVAGLVSRIPAGLGVLEVVFIALLAPPLAPTTLIAAMLCYRAVYYWLPLAVAGAAYLALEAGARRLARPDRR